MTTTAERTCTDAAPCPVHSGGAVCGGIDEGSTDWEPSLKRWPRRGLSKVYVGCCNRLAPLRDTDTRWLVSFGGYVQDRHFRCRSDAGCNTNPGYKRTAHLRYYERND